MSRCITLVILATILVTPRICLAQDDSSPKIVLSHRGMSTLESDVKTLFDLTSPREQQAWPDMQEILYVFALGMDSQRPVVSFVHGGEVFAWEFWLPFALRNDFIDNFEDQYATVFVDLQNADLYEADDETGDDAGKSWLRLIPEDNYAVWSQPKPGTLLSDKERVIGLKIPETTIDRFATTTASAIATLENTVGDPGSQARRRKSFAGLRQQDMDAIKRRPSEARSAFDLRRFSSSILYDEGERLYSEASNVNLEYQLDSEASDLTLSFDVSGLTDSALAESLAQFGQTPDSFASVTALPAGVLSVRLNHPVDPLRRQNARKFLELLTADVHQQIESSDSLEAQQKQAAQKIFDSVILVCRNGFASGNVNGFIEAVHNGSEFTLVGAVSAPGSSLLTEALRQLPLLGPGNEFQESVVTEDEIVISRVRLAEGLVGLVDTVFGVERDLLVGFGADQVWLATGPGSQKLLVDKIKEAAVPQTHSTVVRATIELGPWMQRLLELAEQQEKPIVVADRAAWREHLVRMRQLAESVTSEGDVSLLVETDRATLRGTLTLGKGFLQFIGRQLARFAKEEFAI